jgi:signal-transduction protein with cAMP-binding, CBS, and nucleotidyltransferase domain
MPLILDPAAFQTRLAALPLATYRVGETVLAAGTTSGRLLVLKTGAVEVMKDGVQIAEVSEPGAVFGELSMLLNQHTPPTSALWRSRSSASPTRQACSPMIRLP